MHNAQVEALRVLLAPTGWLDRTRQFAGALRCRARTPQGLLIVGTPDDEPWHMTAHLADESALAGIPELMPTLIRWAPPPGAPPHLSVGLERLEQAGRSETLLVVSSRAAPEPLLDRVADAKKAGSSIFALDQGDPRLRRPGPRVAGGPPGPGPGVFRRRPAPGHLRNRRPSARSFPPFPPFPPGQLGRPAGPARPPEPPPSHHQRPPARLTTPTGRLLRLGWARGRSYEGSPALPGDNQPAFAQDLHRVPQRLVRHLVLLSEFPLSRAACARTPLLQSWPRDDQRPERR